MVDFSKSGFYSWLLLCLLSLLQAVCSGSAARCEGVLDRGGRSDCCECLSLYVHASLLTWRLDVGSFPLNTQNRNTSGIGIVLILRCPTNISQRANKHCLCFCPFFFRFLMQQTQQENDETLFKILWRRMLLRWNYLLFLHIYIPVGTFKMYCADWSYYLKPWKSLYIYHIYFAEQRDRHGGKQHYWTDLYFPRSCWITIFN